MQQERQPALDRELPPLREISARPSLLRSLLELLSFGDLLWMLTLREIKVRYAQTALGIAWAVGQPLVLVAAFAVFFGGFARVGSEGLPYIPFYYSALLPWSFFTTSLAFGVPSLVTNAPLLTKVYFPREILPLAAVLSAIVDFMAAAAVFVPIAWYYALRPWPALPFLLPLFGVQLALALGVTLSLSALNVSYRDVRYALPLVSQIWLYATPVIYPLSTVPEWARPVYLCINPMAAVIDGYRRVLVIGRPPDLSALSLSAAVSGLLLVVSYAYFKRAERRFSDVV